MVTGHYTAISKNKKMVTILHRELEHKGEKFQPVKLEVMRPKTTDVFFFSFPHPSHAVFISMRERKRKY